MNYYKRHIGDYAAATRHLTMLEHGAYTLLLDTYYTTEAPLPADIKAAARKAGARSKDEVTAVETILPEFFTLTDRGWVQERCDTEIAAYHAKAETNRVVGKKGGRPRKQTTTDTQNQESGNPGKTQTVSGNNPDETLTTNHKPLEEDKSSSPRQALDDDHVPVLPGEWIEVFAADHGIEVDHRSVHDRKKFLPLAAGWVAAGVTVGQMRQACAKARAESTEPIAYLPAYADRVLATLTAPARPAAVAAAQGESFRERDQRLAIERWEEATGQIHPDRQAAAGQHDSRVIDVTPTVIEPTFPALAS